MNFNAWGRRRDAMNWNNYTDLPEMKFDRGFTGYEHLDMFGLINMNARLYDPVLGRFIGCVGNVWLFICGRLNRQSFGI